MQIVFPVPNMGIHKSPKENAFVKHRNESSNIKYERKRKGKPDRKRKENNKSKIHLQFSCADTGIELHHRIQHLQTEPIAFTEAQQPFCIHKALAHSRT